MFDLLLTSCYEEQAKSLFKPIIYSKNSIKFSIQKYSSVLKNNDND